MPEKSAGIVQPAEGQPQRVEARPAIRRAARDVCSLIAAMKLLDGGEVTAQEHAVALAALERLNAGKAKPPPG